MAREIFQEEFDQLTARLRDLEKRIQVLEKPHVQMLLASPNGKFRLEFSLTDDLSLRATLLLL